MAMSSRSRWRIRPRTEQSPVRRSRGLRCGFPDATGVVLLETAAGLTFEGATADAHETTLAITDPTSDNTVTIDGSVDPGRQRDSPPAQQRRHHRAAHSPGRQRSAPGPALCRSADAEGATADDHETTLAVTDPTADRTITFPKSSPMPAPHSYKLTTSSQLIAPSKLIISSQLLLPPSS